MTRPVQCIANGRLVLPDEVRVGNLYIQNGEIMDVGPAGQSGDGEHTVDADGKYVLPGLIDMHCDSIEKELEPRPGTIFPFPLAFDTLEKRLAGSGITMMFHALSLSGDVGVRSVRNNQTIEEIVRQIHAKKSDRPLIRHRIHLRYELMNRDGLSIVRDMLEQGAVDLLSFMDHTPSRERFKTDDDFAYFMMKNYGLKGEAAAEKVRWLQQMQQQIDRHDILELSAQARKQSIALASHDDHSEASINEMNEYGVTISEFPLSLEAAQYARRQKRHVIVGAPNVVRGQSHANNLRASDAIRQAAADILCSDYLPNSLLPALFQLADDSIPLHEAVRLATINPAKALGIHDRYGALEKGKKADIIVVDAQMGLPRLHQTIVSGNLVYEVSYPEEQNVR